jgi:hypothetical protein
MSFSTALWWVIPLAAVIIATYFQQRAAGGSFDPRERTEALDPSTPGVNSHSLGAWSGAKIRTIVSRQSLQSSKGDSSTLLLSIVGHVFDVTAGPAFYGVDGGYAFFTGTDASRSFVTGDFENDLHDDIEDFTPSQCSGLHSWLAFYRESTKYPFVGYLDDSRFVLPPHERAGVSASQGHIQDQGQGQELKVLGPAYDAFVACALQGRAAQDAEAAEASKRAICNRQMNVQAGTGSVWCSRNDEAASGGETTAASSDYYVPRRMLILQATGKAVSNASSGSGSGSGARASARASVPQEKCVCLPYSEASQRSDLYLFDGCPADARHCALSLSLASRT